MLDYQCISLITMLLNYKISSNISLESDRQEKLILQWYMKMVTPGPKYLNNDNYAEPAFC